MDDLASSGVSVHRPTAASIILAMGAFRLNMILHPGRMLLRTTIAWLIAGSIGLIARAAILQRPVPLGFAAAVLGSNGALLLAWRLVFSLVTSRRASGSQRVG